MFVLAVCEFPKCLQILFTTIRCLGAFATDVDFVKSNQLPSNSI